MIGTLESPALTRLVARWQKLPEPKEPLWRFVERNADFVRLADLMADFFEPVHR